MPLFLESYQRYECLWNIKSRDYSKCNMREKAYSLMLTDLNIAGVTVADIKAKIILVFLLDFDISNATHKFGKT